VRVEEIEEASPHVRIEEIWVKSVFSRGDKEDPFSFIYFLLFIMVAHYLTQALSSPVPRVELRISDDSGRSLQTVYGVKS
jgi:hypothetical protein